MQILLLRDELELKACADRLVLQAVVILNVVDQFLEQVIAVVDLEEIRIEVLLV